MRDHQFDDFKADAETGLSTQLLAELYDLTPEEVERALLWLNRGFLTKLYTGLVQFFRKIVFEVQMNIKTFKIRQLLKIIKKRGD